MSHDAPREESSPAVHDARTVLRIVLAGIAAFALIVHLFVF